MPPLWTARASTAGHAVGPSSPSRRKAHTYSGTARISTATRRTAVRRTTHPTWHTVLCRVFGTKGSQVISAPLAKGAANAAITPARAIDARAMARVRQAAS